MVLRRFIDVVSTNSSDKEIVMIRKVKKYLVPQEVILILLKERGHKNIIMTCYMIQQGPKELKLISNRKLRYIITIVRA